MYRKPLICRRCGIALASDNWSQSQSKDRSHWRICNGCFHLWRKDKDACYKKKKTAYRRNNYLGQRNADGKIVLLRVIGKRPTTTICELCHREDKPTIYHHWDDADFSKGVWICLRCHNIAEAMDAGLGQMYSDLKARINAIPTHV